jgi:hypothetical protein
MEASAPEAWRIHFFRRHADEDAGRATPALDFFDTIPVKVAAEINAVLDAVAEAPPPSFSGGGKREAMHGDMAGLYEIRVQGGGKNHRLFCILDRGDDLGARASCASTDSPSHPGRQPTPRSTGGSGGSPTSSGGGGPCSSSAVRAGLLGGGEVQVERVSDGGQRLQRRVRPLGGEEPSDRLGWHLRAARELGLAQAQLLTAFIEHADDAIDLLDPVPGALVGLPVLGIVAPGLEVSLGARRLPHGRTIP